MRYIFGFLFCALLSSCKIYKANFMFQTTQEYVVDSLRNINQRADENYTLQCNDYIQIQVFTNKGERIIDPDFELLKGTQMNLTRTEQSYFIRSDGKANFPMVGPILLAGKTLKQADSLLSAEYTKYYFDVYIITKVVNKRAVVIAPTGAKVIPLPNDNITVIELLALAGGMPDNGKATNIKLIRGDNKNPDVQIIDLSTIEGLKKASMNVEPNDVLYIEPIKRILPQTLQDIYPLVSLVLSIFSIIILIATINNNN